MRSTPKKTTPCVPREILLERGVGHSMHTRRQSRIVCLEGEVEISETIMWVGALPLRITRHLHPGESCRIEESGWLILRANQANTRLQLEVPPPAVAMALFAQLCGWLGSHLHLHSGTAQAH